MFVTFEGIEGVGKSTQVELLSSVLSQQYDVVKTREPGGSALAEKIRELLLGTDNEPMAATTELLLMFAARAEHLAKLVRPALSEGKIVICDRFTDATFAYQGGGRAMPSQSIDTLAQLVHGDLQPDLTVLLDAPVEKALARVRNRGNAPDRFERERACFFEKVRGSYLQRAEAEPKRFLVVDAMQGIEQLGAQIEQQVRARL